MKAKSAFPNPKIVKKQKNSLFCAQYLTWVGRPLILLSLLLLPPGCRPLLPPAFERKLA